MGTDGGKFDVSDRLTADRLNRKTVLVETGANISAVAATPGMLAFCTSSGSGFTANHFYLRDASNTIWLELSTLSEASTLLNKTINTDQNTIKDSATNNAGDILVSDGTKFVRKARGTARQILEINAAGNDAEWVDKPWELLGSVTLSGPASSITVDNLLSKKQLHIVAIIGRQTGASSYNINLRFNNDSGNNYSYATSVNGGAFGNTTNTDRIQIGGDNSNPGPLRCDIFVCNLGGTDNNKAAWSESTMSTGTAASVPQYRKTYGKWVSTDQVTRVDIVANTTMPAGSMCLVYGSN